MKNIVLFGAGKSAFVLINYLIHAATQEDWLITIADLKASSWKNLYDSERLELIDFDLSNEELKASLIQKSDLVISMLPASFHPQIAKACLHYEKNLITPSYISAEMKSYDEEAKAKGLLFLNEMGLDPGIDHMSAKKLIDSLQEKGAIIEGFESFTGGLIAPESDNNPWHYKFTWNPRNVVLAGQGPAVQFLHNGRYKYIPYNKLFDRTEIVHIDGYGDFEGYANRDSLKYIDIYGLQGIKTMYRGTFRRPPFCKAWHVLVQIGACDDSYIMEDSENMTYRDFINTFLKYREKDSVEIKLAYYLGKDVDGEEMRLLTWLGLFEKKKIGLKKASPAQILQHLLEEKWALADGDKDMIVMWHLLSYELNGQKHRLESSMVVLGEDEHYTAMAKTVGLPIGIAAKHILNGKIKSIGVCLPTEASIYEPILEELEERGICFTEKETQLSTTI
ncbi:MAG: saccharopine dehydrogenase NADP-binding domain-containing protein [Chitinophagales bacterium]|nr:saccharopine dehydrogenase NADP-binding domain-containing protein [Chitinophagales bacterium]